MEGPGVDSAVRTALETASDPCMAVRRWKVLSGRKAVGCPPRFPLPEILHAVGMLPVLVRKGEERRLLEPQLDEWVFIQEPFPSGLEGALDWVESVVAWAERVSGEGCTEGALDRSMRVYRERDGLAERIMASESHEGPFDPATLRSVIDAGRFLPVESHSMLLAGILGEDAPAKTPGDAGRGDPLLLLARRVRAEIDMQGASGESERRGDP